MKKETKRKIRIGGACLFVLYLLLLTYFLFFSETFGRSVSDGSYRYNIEPFREIRRFWVHRRTLGADAVWVNLVGNVLAFLPFGLFVPMIAPRLDMPLRVTLLSTEFSLIVELIQLVSKVGSFDVDDIILNTLGGILGYIIWIVSNRLRRKIYG